VENLATYSITPDFGPPSFRNEERYLKSNIKCYASMISLYVLGQIRQNSVHALWASSPRCFGSPPPKSDENISLTISNSVAHLTIVFKSAGWCAMRSRRLTNLNTFGQIHDGWQRVKVQNNLGFRPFRITAVLVSNWARYVKSKTIALRVIRIS